MVRVTRPALMLSRKCILYRDNVFGYGVTKLWFITEKLSCGNFSKKKNYRSFFIVCGKKLRRGSKDKIFLTANFFEN